MTEDPLGVELQSLREVAAALDRLDPPAAERVLTWACAKYALHLLRADVRAQYPHSGAPQLDRG